MIPKIAYNVLNFLLFGNSFEMGTRECIVRLPIILGDDFNPTFKSDSQRRFFKVPKEFRNWGIDSNYEIIELLLYLKKKGIVLDIGDIIVYEDYWGRDDFENGKQDTGKVIANFNRPETLVDIMKYNTDRNRYESMDIRLVIDRYEAYEAINDINRYNALIETITNAGYQV